jgi:hypothetical protein
MFASLSLGMSPTLWPRRHFDLMVEFVLQYSGSLPYSTRTCPLPQSLQANSGTETYIRPRPLSSTSLTVSLFTDHPIIERAIEIVVKQTINAWKRFLFCRMRLRRWPWRVQSCSAYVSTLKMEAICSSETSVDFQRTIQRYTPEDCTLQFLF